MALLRMLPLEANDVASSEGVAKDVLAGILVAALLQDLSYTSKTASSAAASEPGCRSRRLRHGHILALPDLDRLGHDAVGSLYRNCRGFRRHRDRRGVRDHRRHIRGGAAGTALALGTPMPQGLDDKQQLFRADDIVTRSVCH